MRLAPFLQWTATFTSLAVAQNATEHAETALSALQEWYNETSGIWNTCGWWNGANCMTVLADLAALDSSVLATATSVFANTYTQAPHVNPAPETFYKTVQSGDVQSHYPPSWPEDTWQASATSSNPTAWLDGYYDDAGWWALAWIAAYDLTSNQGYLDTATGIFDDMTQSWPTNCSGGGIYWDDTHTYVNAIANELFLSVAAHLANRVSTNKTYYVNWATEEWNWFQRSGMINSQNTINDGLLDSCANNGATVWSYNQGVVLGGLVELNKAAPNSTYLSSANTIAMAAITALTDSNHILHDTCEPSCAPDATQFKGIFIRNLQLLQSVSPQDEYVTVIQANANSIWANDRNSENQLSIDWAGPFVNPVNASTHSSAMDALVAAIAVA